MALYLRRGWERHRDVEHRCVTAVFRHDIPDPIGSDVAPHWDVRFVRARFAVLEAVDAGLAWVLARGQTRPARTRFRRDDTGELSAASCSCDLGQIREDVRVVFDEFVGNTVDPEKHDSVIRIAAQPVE